jgi:hypothetical protein
MPAKKANGCLLSRKDLEWIGKVESGNAGYDEMLGVLFTMRGSFFFSMQPYFDYAMGYIFIGI